MFRIQSCPNGDSGGRGRVLNHQRGSKTDLETGTGGETRQLKVVIEVGAVVRVRGWLNNKIF